MELSPEMSSMIMSYGPILLMVVLFYFLLYKPQKKEQNRIKDMLGNLKKGDKITPLFLDADGKAGGFVLRHQVDHRLAAVTRLAVHMLEHQ